MAMCQTLPLKGLTSCAQKKLKYEIFHSKNPSRRKISVFSFKGIERSSLLEDFLRKLEIVNLGPQGSTEENSGTFDRGLGPTYEFFR